MTGLQELKKNTAVPQLTLKTLLFSVIILGFTVISFHNYLLFHSIVEVFSVVVAGGVFIFAWNTQHVVENRMILVMGVGYLFVGTLDLLHALAYHGMGVFGAGGANLATQLWIAARYLESFSLLIAFSTIRCRLAPLQLLAGFGSVVVLLISSIFFLDSFPDCYIEDIGLTFFKKASEIIICAVLILVLFLVYRNRQNLEKPIVKLLSLSVVMTILAELSFIFYIDVYGLSNMVGHIFKLISFYLIYQVVLKTGIVTPFEGLFNDLKENEKVLKESNARLELEIEQRLRAEQHIRKSLAEKETLLEEIHHRVKNNMQVISSLLTLQAGKMKDKRVREILKESQNRVYAMVAVHERLYRSGSLSEVDVGAYFRSIIDSLVGMYAVSTSRVRVIIEADNITVSARKASHLGLIVNELVSNALKYAFPDNRTGEMAVRMHREGTDDILTVSDNGIGLPEEFNLEKSDSLGLQLVRTLVESQLSGEFVLESRNGTFFTARFKVD